MGACTVLTAAATNQKFVKKFVKKLSNHRSSNMSSKTEIAKNPNYCSWCDLACGTRSGLKEHMVTVHGVVNNSNELQTYVLGLKRKSESDPNEVQCSPEKRRKTMDR